MTPMLAHLYALRSHLDAVILAVEAETGTQPPAEPGSCPKCGTSPDQLQDTSTLDGTKRKRCPNCAEEWVI
jgi:hypothetical protein